jgi:NADH dehydrogenase
MDLNEVRVLLLEAGANVMASYPPELRQATQKLLLKKKVEVRTHTKLVEYNGQRVVLGDGGQIDTHTLIWTAGVKAAGIVDRLGLAQAGAGRVRVAASLQSPVHPEVFIIGDAAYVEDAHGQPLPMVSAIQQGKVTAQNIRRILNGEAPQAFHYKDPGLLATIGRNAAVARIWGLSFSGFLAWLIWVFLHIYRLIGFRNRLLVLINWAWEYFFYENQVRLITKE